MKTFKHYISENGDRIDPIGDPKYHTPSGSVNWNKVPDEFFTRILSELVAKCRSLRQSDKVLPQFADAFDRAESVLKNAKHLRKPMGSIKAFEYLRFRVDLAHDELSKALRAQSAFQRAQGKVGKGKK